MYFRLLRKPEFQRETASWPPAMMMTMGLGVYLVQLVLLFAGRGGLGGSGLAARFGRGASERRGDGERRALARA